MKFNPYDKAGGGIQSFSHAEGGENRKSFGVQKSSKRFDSLFFPIL